MLLYFLFPKITMKSWYFSKTQLHYSKRCKFESPFIASCRINELASWNNIITLTLSLFALERLSFDVLHKISSAMRSYWEHKLTWKRNKRGVRNSWSSWYLHFNNNSCQCGLRCIVLVDKFRSPLLHIIRPNWIMFHAPTSACEENWLNNKKFMD